MTLIELVQRHFDELEGWPRSRVTRLTVRFDDGASIDMEPLATLARRSVTFGPAMHQWISDGPGPYPQWHCRDCGAMLTARGGRFQGPINEPCPPREDA